MDRLFRIDFYPHDWLLDTSRLTPEQRGIYIQLISLMYAHRGPIDNDPLWLAGQCGCSSRLVRTLIEQLTERGFIAVSDGKISQKRAELEMNRKRAHLGDSSKGGRATAERRRVSNQDNDLASSAPPDPLPSPSPSLSPKAKEKKESSSPEDLHAMAAVWNDVLGAKLPRVVRIEGARAKKMAKRLRDDLGGDIERWRELCERVARSPLLLGEAGSGWKASVDWVLEPGNMLKIQEGNYEPRGSYGNRNTTRRPSAHENLLAGFGITDPGEP